MFLAQPSLLPIIILFGPPGAGKGTQSQKIVDKYGLTHIATGDLFREHIAKGTDLGNAVQKYMNQGKLVPDQVVIDMVEKKIKQHNQCKGLLFDGFPRSLAQAKALDEKLLQYGMQIQCVIALVVSEATLKQRISARSKTSGRTDDQDDQKIATRLNTYRNDTLPVELYYKNQEKLFSINGIGNIETIFAHIVKVLGRF